MKQSSHRWILACVVAAFVLTLIVSSIDETKLYHAIKTQLAQTGITMDAKDLNLSPMHMGSIRLNDVNIQTQAFTLQAEQISIDLNLAALLTGKALPQALYIRFADINVLQTEKESWLNFLENDKFKLKRIDISQSEIHFEQQHLTLEKVDLDIRDIGKNKSTHLELRAHIGDGRIDSHGYLHIVGDTKLTDDEEQLLARFMAVFQQTYTRFLDLQKADEQAKEAQLEAALERIRSRTMGMHKSHEMKDVIKALFNEL
ncbi:MAG: hypothetical protein L3J61_05180, partial [Ghiorsea sp.]|nr:hypothetical protein [Ghiorsea sp.]